MCANLISTANETYLSIDNESLIAWEMWQNKKVHVVYKEPTVHWHWQTLISRCDLTNTHREAHTRALTLAHTDERETTFFASL